MNFRFPAPISLFHKLPRRARPHTSQNKTKPFAVMAKRPAVPRFWQNIAPALRGTCIDGTYSADIHKPHPRIDKPSAFAVCPRTNRPVITPFDWADRVRHWLLVLEAKHIPFRSFSKAPFPSVYVPPTAAHAALREITAFEQEKPIPPIPQPVERKGAYWYAALLAPLFFWHSLRWSAAKPFSLPAEGAGWLRIGGLDAYKTAANGEWQRAVTSLTLHADGAHLVSNLVMGGIFGTALCRYTGIGFGFFLTVLSGAIGNTVTAHMRPASFMSQGFSTAVFASVGLLAALSAAFAARHAFTHAGSETNRKGVALKRGFFKGLLPVGAGLGLLAMLGGSEAPNVDYLAHVMGLFAGLTVGFIVAFAAPGLLLLKGKANTLFQTVSVAAAFALIAGAWACAIG